jgi:beta-alanine degradation protein BauB
LHVHANAGAAHFRNFFVEILPSKAGAAAVPVPAPAGNRPLVLDNERVRAFHLTLAPGQSTGMHAPDLNGLGVAVTDGTLVVEVPGQPPRTVEFRTGQFQWRESGYQHSLRNVGAAPFEAVDIELK